MAAVIHCPRSLNWRAAASPASRCVSFCCRPLLGDSLEGVMIQLYAALIATLLLGAHVGLKPNKRAYELVAMRRRRMRGGLVGAKTWGFHLLATGK